MPTDRDTSEQIERYLAGEMPEPERAAFETALQHDPGLAQALALEKALRHSLGNRQRRQLLDALSETVAGEEKRPDFWVSWRTPARLAAAAAVALLLTAGGLWWYTRQSAPTQAPLAEQTTPAPPVSETVAPPPSAPPPRASERLAAADRRAFAPNPALDPLVGTMVRAGNAGITVSSPQNDAALPLHNNRVAFVLAGQTADLNALTLRIFNNREADFIAGKPVFSSDIPVENGAFSLKKNLDLPPGRYYVVLSPPGDEEPLTVQRFLVEKQ